MKKRILSLLLCCVMLVGLLPTAVYAEGEGNTDTGKAIQIGASQIEGGQASSVYYGTYKQSSDGSGGYNTDPIKWRVLTNDENSSGTLFLLADQNLDVKPYNSSYTSITWEKSTIRSWLNGYAASENNSGTDYSSDNFIDTAFSSGEQGAIAQTDVYNATQSDGSSNPNPSYSTSGGENTTDKIFLLSIEEANNSSYFPNGNDSRKSTNTAYVASYSGMYGVGVADYWWLRSPGYDAYDAAIVLDSGGVNYNGYIVAYTFHGVRPAFNLNLNSVLFTSAAEGGKADTAVDENLTAVTDYTGSEWKLTLKDSSRSFSANVNGQTSASALAGGSVQITYSGAQTGENEYVSVLLCDGNGNVLYYGNIAQSSASGTASVAVPDGLAAGDYTLKVFSEQCNGDKKTDYASDFVNIDLTITPDEQFTLTPGGTYYFDLSGENIPGTVNTGNESGAASLPDTTLHYVPFTYVGTINAYKLESEMKTDENYAQANRYDHSLFIADYVVTHTVSWDTLNLAGLIFGKDYDSGKIKFSMRVPSQGSDSVDAGNGDSERGTPKSNEWDAILNKDNSYIKNWHKMYSWGQDSADFNRVNFRVHRGSINARFQEWSTPNVSMAELGFQPVLEVLNPDELGADALKAVTLDLNGGKLGGSSDAIQIIVKNGSTFTAPASDGLTRPDGDTGNFFMWLGNDGKLYAPGDSVPAEVTELTVQWTAPTYSVTLETNGGTIADGEDVTAYTYGKGATLPTDVTRTGYTFDGWYDNEGLTGSPVTTIGNTETGDKGYWAKWEVNQYTVTVKPENGEADITITQDYGTPVTAPTLTREGYQFNGWDKSFPAAMPAEDLTITAQWLDIAAPTGEIKIAENSWKSFLNDITFGLFFKDTQPVSITAADNSGKTVKIEYLLSDKELTQAELAGMTFTAYSAPFSINPDNEYVIYAKLTDTSGNMAYINTDGIVLDATVPVISGIEAGKTYCAAQMVTVDEKYIDTVTVNDKTVTLDSSHQFTLNPADGTQTVVVTDKAGNSIEVTVTVNDGHTYEWQSENGQYWQKCKFCNHETTKKDIPTINISSADKVCRTQDYKFSFVLPEGATDAAYGYEFIGLGDGSLTPTVENNLYSGIIKASVYPAEESGFKLIVSAKTAEGFEFNTEKIVTILDAHSGGTATCKDKAKCEVCGESYGEPDADNHTDLQHFPAVAATKTSEGNIEYWYCSGCGKYYKDAKATQEITKADTVTAKLPEEKPTSPKTGDTSNLTLWIALLLASGGVGTATTVCGRKKKRSVK